MEEANSTTLVVRRSVLEGKSFLVNTLVPTIRQLALEKACVLLKTDVSSMHHLVVLTLT